MMNRIAEIRKRLQKSLSPNHIDIVDESHLHVGHAGAAAGGGHFSVTVVADIFADKSTLQRHRMVYEAVGDLMSTQIHALSIKALSVANE